MNKEIFLHQEAIGNAEQYEPQPIIKKDLNAAGHDEAGRYGGESIPFANSCNSILKKRIVRNEYDEAKQQAERREVEEEIGSIEQQKNTVETKCKDLTTVKIPDLQRQISETKEEISELEIEKSKDSENGFKKNFDFWMIFPVFILTTIFLFLFYVSSVHSAICRDIYAQVKTANASNVSSVLNSVFNGSAFSDLNLHWLAPFVFFSFGIILHVLFNKTSKWRIISVVAMLLFIFCVDGLLAYKIESNNHEIRLLMDLADGNWVFYKSSVFLIVLVFGFFTTMGWSILLHNLRENMNPQAVIRKKISLLKQKIKELESQIAKLESEILKINTEIENLNYKIESLKKRLKKINCIVEELKLSIIVFYQGWLRYLENMGDTVKANKLKSECEAVKDRILAEIDRMAA